VQLRLVDDFRRAMDLSLVLDEEGIAHELRGAGENCWELVIDEADLTRAQTALAAFERENPLPVPRVVETARSPTTAVACGLALFLSILAFHVWTGPQSPESAWFSRGSADAAAIVRGEWWRTITALTLHADAGHAVGNAVLGGLLLGLLAHAVGPGVAAILVLLAGAGGTFAAAELLRSDFISVGASTAVFGALGVLAALRRHRRRAWVPLGAGLALLAFLGTSKRADLAGHLCGFACGVALGAGASFSRPLRGHIAQGALALIAAAAPVAAWLAAFR
jgi:rhomboid protease GluP